MYQVVDLEWPMSQLTDGQLTALLGLPIHSIELCEQLSAELHRRGMMTHEQTLALEKRFALLQRAQAKAFAGKTAQVKSPTDATLSVIERQLASGANRALIKALLDRFPLDTVEASKGIAGVGAGRNLSRDEFAKVCTHLIKRFEGRNDLINRRDGDLINIVKRIAEAEQQRATARMQEALKEASQPKPLSPAQAIPKPATVSSPLRDSEISQQGSERGWFTDSLGQAMLNALKNSTFEEHDWRDESPLKKLGYCVGRGSPLSERERHEILADFIETADIPNCFPEHYRSQWGAPGSAARVARTAVHLVKQYIPRDPSTFEVAIACWKRDLAFIRARFGHALTAAEWEKIVPREGD